MLLAEWKATFTCWMVNIFYQSRKFANYISQKVILLKGKQWRKMAKIALFPTEIGYLSQMLYLQVVSCKRLGSWYYHCLCTPRVSFRML
jgi:hypothetical protein